MNRFDEILVYSALERAELSGIFDKFLAGIHARTLQQAAVPLLIKVSDDAKEFIIDRGTDPRFGARPRRRAMERQLVDPLSRFIAADKLSPGDVVEVELESGMLAFFRRARTSRALVS